MPTSSTAAPTVVGVQTVLYQTDPTALGRTLSALDNAARIGMSEGASRGLVVALGDASPTRVLSDDDVAELTERHGHLAELHYTWFGENTGTSRGHNLLAARYTTDCELLVLCNPDIVVDGRALWRMRQVLLDDPRVGIVEGKQLPFEHPKDYDVGTGVTSWASGAFSMIRREVFDRIDGYDEQSFFLYCDDVDMSWRVREAGYEVVFQPAALGYHAKDMTPDAGWMSSDTERYYAAEAALLLAHKWSRDDVLGGILSWVDRAGTEAQREAAAEFRRRKRDDLLVPRRDEDNLVGLFTGTNYAEHRYAL